MATLSDRQFEMDGYLFGRHAPTGVEVTDVDFGSPEARSTDVDRPRADGTRFGREWRAGREITLEVATMHHTDAVLAELGKLCAAWDAAATRTAPGTLSVLRYNVNGRTRRVYGRPRKIEMDATEYKWGKVLVTMTFVTEGPYFYADEPATVSMGLSAASTGGFVFPMYFPASTVGFSEARDTVTIPSLSPSPAVYKVKGPITSPVIECPGRWQCELLMDLESYQEITIDTRPWNLSVRDQDGVSRAGRLSTTSPRLPEMWITPGGNDVILRGSDLTGTSRLTVEAWPTYPSF